MAEIRLNKICKQYGIGLSTLVNFLHLQGYMVPMSPNVKVSDAVMPAIQQKFGKDKELAKAASNTAVRMSTILGTSAPKKKVLESESSMKRPRIEPAKQLSLKKEPISTIPLAKPREYAKRLKIKTINRPFRIITYAFKHTGQAFSFRKISPTRVSPYPLKMQNLSSPGVLRQMI